MSLKKTNKVNTETVNRKQFESQSLMSGSIFTVYKPRPVGIQAGIVGDQLFINSTRTIGGEHHNTVATISNSNQTSNNISMNELNAEDNSAYFLTLAKRNLVKLNQQAANSSVGATQGAPGASKKNLKLPFKHYCISKDSNSLVMSISMENIHDSLVSAINNYTATKSAFWYSPISTLIMISYWRKRSHRIQQPNWSSKRRRPSTATSTTLNAPNTPNKNRYIYHNIKSICSSNNISSNSNFNSADLLASTSKIHFSLFSSFSLRAFAKRFYFTGNKRLRPLNLVTTEGPTIDDCIGIYRGVNLIINYVFKAFWKFMFFL